MTGIAIFFFILSAVVIWGGLIGSMVFLRVKGDVAHYPAGEENEHDRFED